MNTSDPYKDRSHVYANPDLDKGQEAHSRLPDPLVDHLITAFKHKADPPSPW